MDIDTWFWLAVAFWLGTCAGFAVFALVHLGRSADTRRGAILRTVRPDLLSENISRF
jgi:hypothetical protein